VVLGPGEQATLTWTLDREDLKYVGINSRYVCYLFVEILRKEETGVDNAMRYFHLTSQFAFFLHLTFCRYVLESGEFRLAAGPEQDCRLDSWATNPLCASFELQLSDEYFPVCDYACGMWGPDSGNFTQRTRFFFKCCVFVYVHERRFYNFVCIPRSLSPTAGVCGNIVDADACRSTCVAQDWTWNYVDCIEQYYQGALCLLCTV